ncbi:MAG: hypothetical protein Q8O27_01105, partial [Enterobacteriaceae bacterium]|nr:hypothetical protein [Enterobacteriaceae bacterium]
MTIGSNIIPDKLISKTTSKKNIKNKEIKELQENQELKEVKELQEYKKKSKLSKFDWKNMDKKNFALLPGLYEKIKDYAW